MRNMDACLYVGPSDRITLERLIADGKTPQKIFKRATIVLLSGRGLGTNAIIREARVSKPCVWRWQQAYMGGGVERLLKEKGKGPKAGKTRISEEVRLAIVTLTAKEKPANATHWSARMLAEEMGVPHDSTADLEGTWSQAAPDANVQALERSQLRRESRRHRRAVSQSARQGSSAVRR